VYFTFQWDELGRLAAAQRLDDRNVAPSAYVQYMYDFAGTRVLRESSPPSGSLGPTFDAEIFSSLRLNNAEWQPSSSTYLRNADTETAYLAFGGASYGRVLSVNMPQTGHKQHVLLTLSDALGSTAAVIEKATGELVERLTYSAYGTVDSDYRTGFLSTAWAATFSEEYKYTGKDADAEMGIVYFGARFYSPYIGRWLSPDPLTIHGLGSDPNPYAFVHGSPLRYVDANGLCESESDCNNQLLWTGIGVPPLWNVDWKKTEKWWHDAGHDAGKWMDGAGHWLGEAGHSIGCFFTSCGGGPPPPPPSTARPFAGAGAGTSMGGPQFGVGGYLGHEYDPPPPPPGNPCPTGTCFGDRLGEPGKVVILGLAGGPFAGAETVAAEEFTSLELLQGAADRAAATMGPGSGPVYGTLVHSEFGREVAALGGDFSTEVSYLNGEVVPYGTPGSVRLDVVEGPLTSPTALYDLKTGGATLTPGRIDQILSHVPVNGNVPIPVRMIKPGQ
jgi:RHS repeat-associated protein